MTDADFMLAVLEDGPASTMDLIRRSIAERGCGLTPHSRASELRAQGHAIVCTREGEHNGRGVYVYRLGAPNETDAACAEGAAGTSVSLGVPESPGSEPRAALGMAPTQDGSVAARTEVPAVHPSSDPVQLSLLAVA